MKLGERNRHLIRIAAVINGLFLLLSVLLVLIMSADNSETRRFFGKMAAFTIINIVCWLINIFLVVFLLPALNKDKQKSGVLFYILSFGINIMMVQLLSGFVIEELHLQTPRTRFSPLVYAATFNAMSLLALE